jgi:hypothetical protein
VALANPGAGGGTWWSTGLSVEKFVDGSELALSSCAGFDCAGCD